MDIHIFGSDIWSQQKLMYLVYIINRIHQLLLIKF